MRVLNLLLKNNSIIRNIEIKDCSQVLKLMKSLAEFEGYIDEFKVTTSDIEKLCISEKKCGILVAEKNDKINGILVFYFQPFTYDLTPWLIIKELYVDESCRNEDIGSKLIERAKEICREKGGKKIKWEVLSKNYRAIKFYEKNGGIVESNWSIMSTKAL